MYSQKLGLPSRFWALEGPLVKNCIHRVKELGGLVRELMGIVGELKMKVTL